jgi:hypothetical protein
MTLNGNTMYITGDLSQGTTAITSGTTNLIMSGSGVWSNSSTGQLRNNLTFNSAGTITISGSVRFNTGTLTYTAGTMVHSSSNLLVTSSTTLNLNGAGTFVGIDLESASTTTLTSNLNCTNAILGNSTNTTTVNGAYNINVGGNLTINVTTGAITGTSTVVLNGTGNVSMPLATSGSYRLSTTINTAGTSTFVGTLRLQDMTFLYTTGSTIWTSSTLRVTGTTSMILNLNGLTINNLLLSTAVTLNLASGVIISGLFSNENSATHVAIQSTVGGTQRALTLL